MSSHCNKYPECNCPTDVGTKCHLPEEVNTVKDAFSSIETSIESIKNDFDQEAFKRAVLEKYEISLRGGSHRKPVHKHASNYTPPKNRKKVKRTTRKK